MITSTDFMLSKMKPLRTGADKTDANACVEPTKDDVVEQPIPSPSMADILVNCLRPNKQKDNIPRG